jgi:hypothetical protein
MADVRGSSPFGRRLCFAVVVRLVSAPFPCLELPDPLLPGARSQSHSPTAVITSKDLGAPDGFRVCNLHYKIQDRPFFSLKQYPAAIWELPALSAASVALQSSHGITCPGYFPWYCLIGESPRVFMLFARSPSAPPPQTSCGPAVSL